MEEIFLNNNQINLILDTFKTSNQDQSHLSTWKKRSYCPMHIHNQLFENVKTIIETKFVDYKIAFDVVFESSGNLVPWHCDYESLGPFLVEQPFNSIKNNDFISIHFNLTHEGGNLEIMKNWTILSYIHYQIIVWFGIYSKMHKLLNYLSYPLFSYFSSSYLNTQGLGNPFNNMQLHSVSKGNPRISYVIRLIKKHNVKISKMSVKQGIQRSESCKPFSCFIDNVSNETQEAHLLNWESLTKFGSD